MQLFMKLRKRFARLSLRARLSGAFIILIVTSASATIAIGNVVFGQKVVELALSKMEVGLKVADLTLASRMKQIGLLTRIGSASPGEADRYDGFCRTVEAESALVDFAVIAKPDGAELLRKGDPRDALPCTRVTLDPKGYGSSELARFAAAAEKKPGRMLSGIIVLKKQTIAALRYRMPPDEALFLLACLHLGDGAVVFFGSMLNGRMDLVSAPVELLWHDQRSLYDVSLFLGEKRVTTTIGPRAVGTHVDPQVIKRVLRDKRLYVGSAVAVDRTYYTAYMPLRDYRGEAIGILGIGSREEAYVDMRNRTVTLFSALIAGGMIFGFIMTYLFAAWLIRPISALAEGMNRVARGEFDYKVRIGSIDELGRLAGAFNLMVKNIKERDIRLLAMTEERLSHVEKQVSIGRLAAGVAHEINNPLTSVLSLSMLMQKHLEPSDPRHEDLDIIVAETTRCRDIVRSLLDFARETPSENAVVDINTVIRDTLLLTGKYEGMDSIEKEILLSPEPLLVNGDAKKLQQVFTNVITNAAEAMDHRGKIIVVSDEDSSGSFVVVKIFDTGKGIPREDLGRVFEPFFTTKGPGKGTGLGLSVSVGIVRKHNGTIEIESSPGKKTKVTITLPRYVEPQRQEAALDEKGGEP